MLITGKEITLKRVLTSSPVCNIAETEVLLCCAVPQNTGKIQNRAAMKDPSDIESLGNEHL